MDKTKSASIQYFVVFIKSYPQGDVVLYIAVEPILNLLSKFILDYKLYVARRV